MENQPPVSGVSPLCVKCGKQAKFWTSMLDIQTSKIFWIFECKCGEQTWVGYVWSGVPHGRL